MSRRDQFHFVSGKLVSDCISSITPAMPYTMLRLKLALRESIDVETRLVQQLVAAGSHQLTFNLLILRQGTANIGQPAAQCHDGASWAGNEGCERLANCRDGASRDDKDTSTSRSSSHPPHHYATAIEGGVCNSGSIKMDFVKANDAASEVAETSGSVTDMQEGFGVLSMTVQGHDLLQASHQLPSMELDLRVRRVPCENRAKQHNDLQSGKNLRTFVHCD